MSAILNVLRELIAWLTGEPLVLFDPKIMLWDGVRFGSRAAYDARQAICPPRSFDDYPPQAWAAP